MITANNLRIAQNANIVPLRTLPDRTITLPTTVTTVSIADNYHFRIPALRIYRSPEQMLALLEQSLSFAQHSAIYHPDGSITFTRTTSEFRHNGEELQLLVHPHIFEIPTDVVRRLEQYFEINLHDYLHYRQRTLQG